MSCTKAAALAARACWAAALGLTLAGWPRGGVCEGSGGVCEGGGGVCEGVYDSGVPDRCRFRPATANDPASCLRGSSRRAELTRAKLR